jgi:hypothetical protein
MFSVIEDLHISLDEASFPYYVGGSVASTTYGDTRITNDIDIVVDFAGRDPNEAVHALQPRFFVDDVAFPDVISAGEPYNVFHRVTGFKVDIFPMPDRPFSKEQMRRRKLVSILPDPNGPQAYYVTAEDIVLQKLGWLTPSGGVSETQWRDILGVLKWRKQDIDLAYITIWAIRLGFKDRLLQALQDAGIDPPAE